MKKLILFVAAAFSASVMAEEKALYWGLNHLTTEVTISGDFDADKDSEPTAWFFNFGRSFSKYFALEARLGKGLSSDSFAETGWFYGGDIEVESLHGVYGKLSLPLGEHVAPYALFGYTKGKASLEFDNGYEVSSSESDTSLGFGINFLIGESSVLNVEKTKYIDKGGIEVSGLSFGYAYRF